MVAHVSAMSSVACWEGVNLVTFPALLLGYARSLVAVLDVTAAEGAVGAFN
jgi:hypothetical protein